MRSKGFDLTDGIVDVFEMKSIKQCIATGTPPEKMEMKIKISGVDRWFSKNNIFTSNMVKKGKPAPDLFLFACEKMGVRPEEAIVVEDSVAGLIAAIKAGCLPVAFTKYALKGDEEYFEEIKELGVQNVFDDMKKLQAFVEKEVL